MAGLCICSNDIEPQDIRGEESVHCRGAGHCFVDNSVLSLSPGNSKWLKTTTARMLNADQRLPLLSWKQFWFCYGNDVGEVVLQSYSWVK